MIVEYTPVAVPEATDQASLENLLHAFATTPLPAFVIRQAGHLSSLALAKLYPLLPRDMDLSGRLYDDLERNEKTDDLGLHMDLGEIDGPNETIINFHHTEKGSVRASFFLPGPNTLERARQRNRNLPVGTDDLFRTGRVDTNEAGQYCHWAQINQYDAVLFKEGLPLVHDFTTLSWPRLSTATIGRLAVPNLLGSITPKLKHGTI